MYNGNKITNKHLAKTAILYIRQSTVRQIYENNESTIRQYALKDKLITLGWPAESIITLDQDLGKSGADADNRDGFKKLVSEVSNNLVGAVACIECSRLSRSSADWSRLTQFCAYTNTLLIDADGIYDPNDFNDRLLLGLKGTMSEAELHFLKERMRGGLMNKVKRGELKIPIPIGYLYDDDRVVKDPDMEIQNAVNMVFEVFRRVGSAHGVAQYFKAKGYKFPYRIGKGFRKGEVQWIDLRLHNVLSMIHNPYYAGVYYYGENQIVWTPEGKKSKKMPREDWHVFIKGHHDMYISYEEFEENERVLLENYTQRDCAGKKTPPREGPALIQGLVWCGKCGRRMTVRYNKRGSSPEPIYVCQKDSVEGIGYICQFIFGQAIDQKIQQVLLKRLTPEVIKQAVSVQKELDHRQHENLNYYHMRVEKCRYDVELARRRFMNVDPDNRLVALELESSWNVRLKEFEDARNEYEHQLEKIEKESAERNYSLVDNLVDNFSEIFQSDDVSDKDKKRMVRYLIEDVTLLREENDVKVHIRYRGHTTESFSVGAPARNCERWRTDPDVIKIIDNSAQSLTVEGISALLNRQGYRSGKGQNFTPTIVKRIMYAYSIANMKERYMNKGYIISAVKAASMGISTSGLMYLIRTGKYTGEYVCVNSRNEYVFPPEGCER